MALNRPTLKVIIERVEADILSKAGISKPLRRSVIRAFSYAIGGACHLIYGFLDYIAKQLMPDTADGQHLERWASIWGISRKIGSYAERDIDFSGVDGSIIPAKTYLKRSDGLEYYTDLEVTISSGIATVKVTADEYGKTGNLDIAVSLQLISPIAGVEAAAVVVSTNQLDGADAELDPPLLKRLLNHIQEPPRGGSENDYIQWALELDGVSRAWTFPERFGPGTMGLAFVKDADTDIFPNAASVLVVQDYIDFLRPVTCNFTAFAPIEKLIALDISIKPNTLAVRTAVENELKDFFIRESVVEGSLLISKINEAISIAANEEDHILNTPTVNPNAAPGELMTLGAITWQTLA